MQKLLADLRKRQEPPLSQAEVARRLSVSRVAVSHWELGGRLPDPENLGKLLDLYGATNEERLEAWRLRSLPCDEPAPTEEALSPEAGEEPSASKVA